ncbi:MAG: TonB-dependent receptor plug domain-containing protein, partial [Vicinamibacteraceae bacterium]
MARIFLVASAMLAFAHAAWAQRPDTRVAQSKSSGEPARSLLERPARLSIERMPLESALNALTQASGVPLAFSPARMPRNASVSCACANVDMSGALDQLLAGTALEYVELSGQIVLFLEGDSQGERGNLLIGLRHPGVLASSMGGKRDAARGDHADENGDHTSSPNIMVRSVTAPATHVRVGTITGTVTEAGTNSPVVNAQIAVDGAGRAFTNADGRYRITDVPPGRHNVSVASIGYRRSTLEVEVADGATVTLDFALELSPTRLDELVVTATGEQRRVELGHVLGSVRADAIARSAPIANFSDLIQSRVAGVTVLTPDGGSGLSSQIRIRGMNSFTLANDPIVVVDGVRVENTPGQRSNPTLFNFAARHTTGRLADINPREIESIEIVKGPSAATLYGTDAANGVILINTKRGMPGRTTVDVYTEIGAIEPSERYPDSWYRFGRSTASGAPVRCTLLAEAANSCMADSLSSFNPMTNSVTTPLGTGVRQVYGAQLSGGMPSLTYFLSGEYENERGFLRMPDTDQERYRAFLGQNDIPAEIIHPNGVRKVSLRGTMTGELADRGDLRLSVGFVTNETRVAGTALPRMAQFGPGYRDEFDGWRPRGRPSDLFGERNRERTSHFTGSLSSTFLASSWLSLRGSVGLDYSGSHFDHLIRRGEGSFTGTV